MSTPDEILEEVEETRTGNASAVSGSVEGCYLALISRATENESRNVSYAVLLWRAALKYLRIHSIVDPKAVMKGTTLVLTHASVPSTLSSLFSALVQWTSYSPLQLDEMECMLKVWHG